MYAQDLMSLLHLLLSDDKRAQEARARFERLREFRLLPQGRERANQRLSNEQIANAILGFSSVDPRWAGHDSLILWGLRPIGGPKASLNGATTLKEAICELIQCEEASRMVARLLLEVPSRASNAGHHALLVYDQDGLRRFVSFTSKAAHTLMVDGAEATLDIWARFADVGRQLCLGSGFFVEISKQVAMSRCLNLPPKTDWREYETEEERNSFHRSLGARPGSRFLNIGVETTVSWPVVPIRVKYGSHNLALFPKTGENSHSISIDLEAEGLSSEEAITHINRFLSLVAWCDNHYAILREGWSGSSVPVPVPRREVLGATDVRWTFNRQPVESADLRERLAYYREALNARASAVTSYEVLAFFKVFEARNSNSRESRRLTEAWVAENFEAACETLPETERHGFEKDRNGLAVEKYIHENCRIATAHASEKNRSDADASLEIRRLKIASRVMQALARHYIMTTYSLTHWLHKDW